MDAVIIFLSIYSLLYCFVILWIASGFTKVKKFEPCSGNPAVAFSIIVPFRNEAENLPNLLESIKLLEYPKELFELLLIDDFSADSSASIVYKWRMDNGEYNVTMIENVRVSKSPKKDAIMRAIPIVQNKWVITTDADCTIPVLWLQSFSEYIESRKPSMIAGGVSYGKTKSLIAQFQNLDLLSLQGATIGSFGIKKPFMCNGANFAYTKELFTKLNGFAGNDSIAGGDDVFLLQKAVQKYPEKVHYLKSRAAIVETKALNTWRSLFNQRIRWASKSTSYISDFGEFVALVVFFGNISIIAFAVLAALEQFDYLYFGVAFGFKFLTDYILLLQSNRFFSRRKFFFPLIGCIFYPVFAVVVAIYALFGKYVWKGRVY